MRISDWSSDVCSSDLQAGPCGDARSCALRSRQQREQLLDGRVHCIGARRDMIEVDIGGGEARVAEQTLHLLQRVAQDQPRSEEHTSELQSLMRTSYAVFCLKKNNQHSTIVHSVMHARRNTI